jgi:WD40 repeat protein
VSGGRDNAVRLWDLKGAAPQRVFEGHIQWIGDVDVSPEGKRILAGSADTSARVWDANTGELLQVMKGHSGPVAAATFSPDGQQVVTGD